jgi:hypothetical protein
MTHGTRQCYQRTGCDCTPCRAAEATYRATLRRQWATGKPPLGAHISAADTWRKIRQLHQEQLSNADIASRLGLKRRRLEWQADVVTVRTAVKVRLLFRLLMNEQASI